MNHKNIYDYLLGEGECSSLSDGRFKQVFRAYHEGRALPELSSGDPTSTDSNFSSGQADLTLESHLARPLDNWYSNFVIDFYLNGEIEASVLIEEYISDLNCIVLNPAASFDYDSYKIREYRFFNGSQDYPWPGYSFIRFAVKYTGEITVDAEGFPSEKEPLGSSNPANFIRCLLTDEIWGLGIDEDELDSDSFDYAEILLLNVMMEGAVTRETTVAALIEEVAKLWPLKLAHGPQGICLHLREPEPAPSSGNYIQKVLPEDLTQQLELPEVVLDPLAELTKELIVNFRLDGDGKFDLSLPPTDADADEQATEFVQNMGRRVTLELPFVYDQDTADIVLWREAQVRSVHNRRLKVSVAAEALIFSKDNIKVGEKISVPDNILDPLEDWEVAAIQETCDTSIQLELAPLPDIYTGELSYPFGTRPLHSNESSFKPPTDFSQTHPEPVREVFAEPIVKKRGEDDEFYVCEVTWKNSTENYSGAQVWFALGTDIPERVTDEEVTDQGLTGTGKAQFRLGTELRSFKVIVYSVSENKELLGFPVVFAVNEEPVATCRHREERRRGCFRHTRRLGIHRP